MTGMVSFWPFRGNDTSAASFEKVLATLSTKINKVSTTNDSLKQNQRRVRVLWTLYTCFAYLISILILTLVVGWSNWNAAEYTGLAGGPVTIYGVRLVIDAYYNYRISGTQHHLNDLNKQKETAISKLKAATKYDSTQQLLDKYGGTSPTPLVSPGGTKRKQSLSQSKSAAPQGGRTGIAPPPTANIPGRRAVSGASSPHTPQEFPSQHGSAQRISSMPRTDYPSEEFAPNAFSASQGEHIMTAAPEYAPENPRWYDRLLDVVLGEDETQPKNRIVLICQSCRLVNGQAPPGTRSLEDLGKWRCSSCGAMNGSESETSKMIRQVAAREPEMTERSPTSPLDLGNERDDRDVVDEDEPKRESSEDSSADDDNNADKATTPAGSTRSKARQRKKG